MSSGRAPQPQEVLDDYRQAIRKVIIEHVLNEEKAGHKGSVWSKDRFSASFLNKRKTGFFLKESDEKKI